MNDCGSWLAVLKVMDVIRGPGEGIHRYRHRANFGRAKKRSDEFGRIRKHDEDAVATRYPQFQQRVSGAICKG